MRIDVDAICRHVLAREPGEGELEARIGAVCRNLYGDEHRAAARAVLNAIESHAERAGVSRLEAMADLARGQAEVGVTREAWSSLDEVPPELRERFQQMMRDGKPGTVARQRVVHWDAADGPPSEEVARAIGEALGRGELRPGQRVVVRRSSRWRAFIVLFVAVAAVAAVQLIGAVLKARRPSGRLGRLIEQIAQLEEQHRKQPDDVDTSLDLATAYARKLLFVESLEGLKQSMPPSPAQDPELAEQWQEATRKFERATRATGGPEEAQALAQQGEALARQVQSLPGLSPEEQVQAHLLLGYFLLAQGRTDEARQASEGAADLAPGDVGVHLLNAMICERTGQFDDAIRENQKAAAGLAAWAEEGDAMRRCVAWGMGSQPVADEATWRKHARDIAAQVRSGLELHTSLLRTLDRAQEQLRSIAPRSDEGGPPG